MPTLKAILMNSILYRWYANFISAKFAKMMDEYGIYCAFSMGNAATCSIRTRTHSIQVSTNSVAATERKIIRIMRPYLRFINKWGCTLTAAIYVSKRRPKELAVNEDVVGTFPLYDEIRADSTVVLRKTSEPKSDAIGMIGIGECMTVYELDQLNEMYFVSKGVCGVRKFGWIEKYSFYY